MSDDAMTAVHRLLDSIEAVRAATLSPEPGLSELGGALAALVDAEAALRACLEPKP